MNIENTDFDIRWFDVLESTNNYCKLLEPHSVEEFTVICAHSQTAGIGQQGNTWVSEPGKNLTFSLILKPTFLPAAEQYNLTMALAVAIAESVEAIIADFASHNADDSLDAQHSDIPPVNVKWPNDIYIGDRKVCGILVTNQLGNGHIEQSICGVGLNVNQTQFPDWVPNPTSLLLQQRDLEPSVLPCALPLDGILNSLLQSILHRYRQLQQPKGSAAIKSDYLHRLYRIGIESNYIVGGHPIRATITGVERFGHLQLVTDSGRNITCAMKEIQFV